MNKALFAVNQATQQGKAATHSRQRGASLIEGILFLGLAAVVAIGAFAVFQGGWSSSQVRTESQYMQATVSAVHNMYANTRDYGSANITQTLVNNRAVPAPMIVGTGLRNSWNGAVTVTGASDVFTLQTANVPRKECTEMAQLALNPIAVRINGAAQTLPVSPTAAAAACSTAANSIAWDIR